VHKGRQHVQTQPLTSSVTSASTRSLGFPCDGLIGVKVGQMKVLTESGPNSPNAQREAFLGPPFTGQPTHGLHPHLVCVNLKYVIKITLTPESFFTTTSRETTGSRIKPACIPLGFHHRVYIYYFILIYNSNNVTAGRKTPRI